MTAHLYIAALSCNRLPMAYAMVLYNTHGLCQNIYTAACEETLATAQDAFGQSFPEERFFGLGMVLNPETLAARMYADTLAIQRQGSYKVISTTDVPGSLLNLACPGFPQQPKYLNQAMGDAGYYPSSNQVETCRALGYVLNPQYSLLRQAQRGALIHQAALARNPQLNRLRMSANTAA